jgi:hypothetical protein
MVRGGRAEAPVPRSDVSSRLDQKTANFKAAIDSSAMQWRALPEETRKKSTLANKFRFIKNNNNK